MNRNYLHGKAADKINAVLAGCAFNLKKILRKMVPEGDALSGKCSL
jgi:IS5 family transposase